MAKVRTVRKALPVLDLPVEAATLARLKKGDSRKATAAILLRKRTAVSTGWRTIPMIGGGGSRPSRCLWNGVER